MIEFPQVIRIFIANERSILAGINAVSDATATRPSRAATERPVVHFARLIVP